MSLTKNDIQIIKEIVYEGVQPIKDNITDIKSNVEFIKDATIEILSWADDIHKSLVKNKLPERVEKLESIHPRGSHRSLD